MELRWRYHGMFTEGERIGSIRDAVEEECVSDGSSVPVSRFVGRLVERLHEKQVLTDEDVLSLLGERFSSSST